MARRTPGSITKETGEAIEFIRNIVGGDEEKFGLKLEDAYIYAQEDDKYLAKLEDEIKAYEQLGIRENGRTAFPCPCRYGELSRCQGNTNSTRCSI